MKEEYIQNDSAPPADNNTITCRKRTFRRIFAWIAVSLFLVAGGLCFVLSHAHTVQFNDWFVVGSTAEEILKQYGKFDLMATTEEEAEAGHIHIISSDYHCSTEEFLKNRPIGTKYTLGYYCIDHLLMNDRRVYYAIKFTQDGVAESVKINVLSVRLEECQRHDNSFPDFKWWRRHLKRIYE